MPLLEKGRKKRKRGKEEKRKRGKGIKCFIREFIF
jgi:hypothetical protein